MSDTARFIDETRDIISNPRYTDLHIALLFLDLQSSYGPQDSLVQKVLILIGKYRPELYERIMFSFEMALNIQRAEKEFRGIVYSTIAATKILSQALNKYSKAQI